MVQPHIRGRTLEIGCGSGTFTTYLAVLAEYVPAIDINQGFVARARHATANHGNISVERAAAAS